MLNDTPLTRICSKCEQEFPLTAEYFHRGKACKYGFKSECKECIKQKRKQYYEDHQECIKQKSKQYYEDHKDEEKQRSKQYQDAHKDEKKQRNKQYQEVHKDELKQQRKQYNEARKQCYKDLYEAHKDELNQRYKQYYESHKYEISQRKKQYNSTEQGRLLHRIALSKRRSLKRSVPGQLTSTQIQQKLKAQKYRCYYASCNHAKFKKENGKYVYHMDHTIPLSRSDYGPRNDVNYVVLACPSCNLRKNDKLPHEWLEGGRLF